MLRNLYLTPAERSLFEKLSAKVREGWTVIDEKRTYTDDPLRTFTRVQLLHLHDPELKVHMEAVRKCPTVEKAIERIAALDFSRVGQPDLAELVFALGPSALGTLIERFLGKGAGDSGVEQAAVLSVIRNSLLASLQRKV